MQTGHIGFSQRRKQTKDCAYKQNTAATPLKIYLHTFVQHSAAGLMTHSSPAGVSCNVETQFSSEDSLTLQLAVDDIRS